MKPYVYEIEHIETGKKYIGSRTRKGCDPSELLILGGDEHPRGYLTSSKIVNEIIDREGNSVFKINFIEIFIDKNAALNRETELLLEVDARNNSDYYNLHNNDYVVNIKKLCDLYGVDNPAQIDFVREKNSKAKTGENHPMFGKPLSEEHKKKISRKNSGESHYLYGKCLSKEHKDNMSKSLKGRLKSEEHKKKLSKPKERVTCPHCGKEGGLPQMKQWHFDNCKEKKEEF